MITHKVKTKLEPKSSKPKHDPYETIKIMQKNLIGDFDEIIAEKRIYASLMHTDIQSPLYHIEKLSELIGKAKAIIKSKVYKIDRRTALQKAIDLFGQVKDRLSLGVLDDLRNYSRRRQKNDGYNRLCDNPPRFERNYSKHEVFQRNIVDSMALNRKRLGREISEANSEHSDKSANSSDKCDHSNQEYCENLWTTHRSSSTSSFEPTQNNQQCNSTFGNWPNFGLRKETLDEPTPCVSSFFSPPYLPALFNAPPLPDKSPEKQPSPPQKEESIEDEYYISTPNVHLNELEDIQATLKNLGNFENYDGRSSDSGESHYYYVDGELTEISPPKYSRFKQGHGNNNLKVSEFLINELDKKLKEISKKTVGTKRKIGDVDADDKEGDKNLKKTKIEVVKIKKNKLVREKKLYVKESPEIIKIVKKYKK